MQVRQQSFDEKPTLILADRNNELKFQFLSHITKPDYRKVEEREDKSRLLREQQLREKLYQQKAQR